MKTKEAILKRSELFKHNPGIWCSLLDGIPDEKLIRIKQLCRLNADDEILLLIECLHCHTSDYCKCFVVSDKGISSPREEPGSFTMWEEIDEAYYLDRYWGKFLILELDRKIKLGSKFDTAMFGIKRKDFWQSITEMINEIVDSIPPDKGRIIAELYNLDKNCDRYKLLKERYFRDFVRTYTYPFAHFMLGSKELDL